jgi:hypothetical protein
MTKIAHPDGPPPRPIAFLQPALRLHSEPNSRLAGKFLRGIYLKIDFTPPEKLSFVRSGANLNQIWTRPGSDRNLIKPEQIILTDDLRLLFFDDLSILIAKRLGGSDLFRIDPWVLGLARVLRLDRPDMPPLLTASLSTESGDEGDNSFYAELVLRLRRESGHVTPLQEPCDDKASGVTKAMKEALHLALTKEVQAWLPYLDTANQRVKEGRWPAAFCIIQPQLDHPSIDRLRFALDLAARRVSVELMNGRPVTVSATGKACSQLLQKDWAELSGICPKLPMPSLAHTRYGNFSDAVEAIAAPVLEACNVDLNDFFTPVSPQPVGHHDNPNKSALPNNLREAIEGKVTSALSAHDIIETYAELRQIGIT